MMFKGGQGALEDWSHNLLTEHMKRNNMKHRSGYCTARHVMKQHTPSPLHTSHSFFISDYSLIVVLLRAGSNPYPPSQQI